MQRPLSCLFLNLDLYMNYQRKVENNIQLTDTSQKKKPLISKEEGPNSRTQYETLSSFFGMNG